MALIFSLYIITRGSKDEGAWLGGQSAQGPALHKQGV